MKKRIAFTSRFGLVLFALVALEAACDRTHAQASPTALSTNTQPAIKMNQFVIIFRQGPRKLTKAELARRQQEISAWARAQNTAGHKLEPRILTPEVLRPGVEHDNGVGKDAWPITALLFLEASDLAIAAKVAGSHPANHFGVSVEVRPWAPPVVPAASPVSR